MNGKEFYNIVKTEGLNKFNIGDSFEIAKVANVLGCINDNGWVVYETDERGAYHVISKHSSEEEGLEVLLNELRNKKRKEDRQWQKNVAVHPATKKAVKDVQANSQRACWKR